MGSNDLADKKCVPCKGGVPPLRGEDLDRLLEKLGGGWQVKDEHHLEKNYDFPDFRSALAFANQVGELAEDVGHHPDLQVAWGKLGVTVWTHKVGGLVEADFIFAAKVDRIERQD